MKRLTLFVLGDVQKLDTAAELLKQLIGAVQSGFSETVSAIKSVKADTSAMLEQQDSLQNAVENGFKEMRIGFTEVKEEIHLLRDDFRELIMHEVSELRSEIAEIKATLARMQEAG